MPNTHGEIQEDVKKLMNDIAVLLDNAMNGPNCPKGDRQWGFSLLMFGFDGADVDSSRMNYISNSGREDMLTAMKEFIARYEGNYVEPEEALAN